MSTFTLVKISGWLAASGKSYSKIIKNVETPDQQINYSIIHYSNPSVLYTVFCFHVSCYIDQSFLWNNKTHRYTAEQDIKTSLKQNGWELNYLMVADLQQGAQNEPKWVLYTVIIMGTTLQYT